MTIICDKLGAILVNMCANIELASYGRPLIAQRNRLLESVSAADFIQSLCIRLDIPFTFKPTLV